MHKYITTIRENKFPIEKGYILNSDELVIKEVIDELMCNKRLNLESLSERINVPANDIKNLLVYNTASLELFREDGVIEFDENNINLTEYGVLFIRNVAASLDPLYKNQTVKYSKSV